MDIRGSCHCGNLAFGLAWPDDGAEIPMRLCGCSFCVKHAGSWTSHRDARLRVSVRESSSLSKYRFGTRTADFCVCANCGVTPWVLCEIDGVNYAVVNVNTFDDRTSYKFSSTATDFDGEDTGSRLERRKRNWISHVEVNGA